MAFATDIEHSGDVPAYQAATGRDGHMRMTQDEAALYVPGSLEVSKAKSSSGSGSRPRGAQTYTAITI